MLRFSDSVKYCENPRKGTLKNGVIEFWPADEKKAKTITALITISEVESALKKYFNPRYGIYEAVRGKEYIRAEQWIEASPNEELKEKRRDRWENDSLTGKYSAKQALAVDSAVKVVLALYQKWKGGET